MIELPNKKKCYNLPEQVAQNLLNINYLAEQYKNIDALPTIWQTYKQEFDNELETFGEWTTTFEGWTESLNTYLANMSSAAVGAIAGQNIAPAAIAATGPITAPSIIENMSGYSFAYGTPAFLTIENIYVSACKNGNKLTLVMACNITRTAAASTTNLGFFTVPASVFAKLYPSTIAWYASALSFQKIYAIDSSANAVQLDCVVEKGGGGSNLVKMSFLGTPLNNLTENAQYYVRVEQTFLLNDGLI